MTAFQLRELARLLAELNGHNFTPYTYFRNQGFHIARADKSGGVSVIWHRGAYVGEWRGIDASPVVETLEDRHKKSPKGFVSCDEVARMLIRRFGK